MKIEKEKVKSGKEVVGIVETPRYESLEEAVAALTGPVVLSLVNSQNATNIKNEYRAQFNREPSEAKRIEQAQTELFAKPAEELVAIATGQGGAQGWITRRADELLVEWSKKRSVAAAEAAKVEAADEAAAEEEPANA